MTALLFALIVCFSIFSTIGCSNTTKVKIKVKVQSEIDLNRYSNLAIIPFVQEEGGKEDWGDSIAYALRGSISKSGKFQVMNIKEAKDLLGDKILIEMLSDEDKLKEIGSVLGVDGFITGTFKFRTMNEARSYYVERYSPRLQQYVYDEVPYFQRTYLLSTKFVMIDALTGKTILDDNYNKRGSQAHNIASLLISTSSEGDAILQSLVASASTNFANKLVPHYENEERILVK